MIPEIRRNWAASALMVRARPRWLLVCVGCGHEELSPPENGMDAGARFRDAGWTPENGEPFCPECADLMGLQ